MAELLLGVNIDHIATLRNARGTAYPDPVQAAFIVEQAGADGITAVSYTHLDVYKRQPQRCSVECGVSLKQTLSSEQRLLRACPGRRKAQ